MRRQSCSLPRNDFLRFALLLLFTGLILVGLGVSAQPQRTNCTAECILCILGSCDGSLLINGASSDDPSVMSMNISTLDSKTTYHPGDRCTMRVGASTKSSYSTNNPSSVTLAFTPPTGATNTQFARPPDRQEGSTYYWDNLPVDANGDTPTLDVSFQVPDETGEATTTVWTEWESQYSEEYVEGNTSDINVVPQSTQAQNFPSAQSAPVPQGDDLHALHQIDLWIGAGPDKEITEAIWNHWLGLAPAGTPFIGIQFPLGSLHTDSNGYRLPVLYNDDYAPQLTLIDYTQRPSQVVYTQTLVYQPEYIDLLNRAFPGNDDLYWVALGLAGDADVNPPSGLDIAAGDWEAHLSIWLDLQSTGTELLDEEIYLYGGFEGDGISASALERTALDTALATTGTSTHLFQGLGVTIVGPVPMRLRSAYSSSEPLKPAVQLGHGNSVSVAPGQRISFTHSIANLSGGLVQVQLAVNTDLGSDVGLYAGEWGGPTLPLEPLANPLPLAAHDEVHVWLIGQAPAAAQGIEAWEMTASVASEPNETTTVTDLIWVGDWMTPVPNMPIRTVPWLFVPLAIR